MATWEGIHSRYNHLIIVAGSTPLSVVLQTVPDPKTMTMLRKGALDVAELLFFFLVLCLFVTTTMRIIRKRIINEHATIVKYMRHD